MTVDWINRVHIGDCRELMRRMIAEGVRVQCVVTSPPYWGLRDYATPGQFGLERTWVHHVARMRGVFRLVRELLAEDGTLWLNYGDSYANVGKWGGRTTGKHTRRLHGHNKLVRARRDYSSLKGKDLIGMPWRIALALQSDGWWLRSDIIWAKPNPMPESMDDRPTKAHEYLFLLARSDRYHYNAEAIRERTTGTAHSRGRGINPKAVPVSGWATGGGEHTAIAHAAARGPKDESRAEQGLRDSTKFGRGAGWRTKQNASFSEAVTEVVEDRNVRSVWTIPTEPFPGAHFATFPRDLVRRCVLAGSRPGDVVFDPFMGSGTVAEVAEGLGRRFIGCELNAEYASMYGTLRAAQMGAPF